MRGTSGNREADDIKIESAKYIPTYKGIEKIK